MKSYYFYLIFFVFFSFFHCFVLEGVNITKYQTENKIPNCYFLKFQEKKTQKVCLPNLLVGGFKKCGTSALFHLIELHPEVIPTRIKEYCIGENKLIGYLKGLPSPTTIHNKTLISGCFDIESTKQIYKILKPKPFHIFVIVRDYPEKCWASYNFWCKPDIDPNCTKIGSWTNSQFHYRSPEMFHELVLLQIKNTNYPLWFPSMVSKASIHYKDLIQQYLEFIPPQYLHVIHSVQLEENPEEVWDFINKFQNFSQPHPFISTFKERRYNTQDNKGAKHFTSSEQYKKDVYEISGNRSMLVETKEILNKLWKPDCLWLKETYNLTTLTCY